MCVAVLLSATAWPPCTTPPRTRRGLCSYTHPSLDKGSGALPAFASLDALKRRVTEQTKLHFCDLCLTGRKVRRPRACLSIARASWRP
jgi:hypothetical protein